MTGCDHRQARGVRRRELDAVPGQAQGRLDNTCPGKTSVLLVERREPGREPGNAAGGDADGVVDDRVPEHDLELEQLRLAAALLRGPEPRRSSRGCELDPLARRSRSRGPPPRRPVMTVSATHEAREAATAASAAEPPSSRISSPTSTVAGCPAATAACTGRIVTISAQSRLPGVRVSSLRSQWGGGWWPPGPRTTWARRRRRCPAALLLPFRETAVSAVRRCFPAARLDCGVT